MLSLLLTICLVFWLTPIVSSAPAESRPSAQEYDVVIYGNTVAAMAAAIQTVRMKKTVAIVFPGNTIGGLTASGLGWTDSKNGNAIGGIAREFYGKVYAHYRKSGAWKRETRSKYISRKIGAQPGPAIDDSKKVQWTFEPKVAEYIWENWMKDGKIPVYRNQAIDRSKSGVVKKGGRITSFKTLDGTVFKAKMFIDAGYEGDLMATAGIPYRVGREAKSAYSESAAGVAINSANTLSKIDPYMKKGDPKSGLLYGVDRIIGDTKSVAGNADPIRLQSYNYRLCLTKEAGNRVPFSKPAGYNESNYELLFRYIEAGYKGPFFTSQLMPNIKTDSNARGQVSTDLIGGNYNTESNYPEFSYAQRAANAREHKLWTQGLLWTLANHERVPESIRKSVSAWGHAKDEFVKNGNWPYELYIREGRRMYGSYTMRQSDIQQPKYRSNAIAMGAYTLDVHQVSRVLVQGKIYDDGLVHVPIKGPFSIPYEAIIPKAGDATNFLNPVTMSSTHIAYSSIRMEPTYMSMGQSAATAAVMAIEQGVKVQDIDREKLRARLIADKQVLRL
ncbi:hypothetical protein FALBO_12912 [Fusarium albosuccineum]|uniref:Xanthan lyase n=1 Tax=Fusarium albosuccineum TaxID=1237068 RepID=A0A8H4L2H4_9HYPO|nr:hypothetical protein FALBO_12912 [Fusarium albosuccineum]